MTTAGRSAGKGRQFRLAFLLNCITTPTEISAFKPNEKLFRLLEPSSLHVNSPLNPLVTLEYTTAPQNTPRHAAPCHLTPHHTTPHTKKKHTTSQHTTLYHTTQNFTALHCAALHYTTLHYTTLHCTALHYTHSFTHYTHPISIPLTFLPINQPNSPVVWLPTSQETNQPDTFPTNPIHTPICSRTFLPTNKINIQTLRKTSPLEEAVHRFILTFFLPLVFCDRSKA